MGVFWFRLFDGIFLFFMCAVEDMFKPVGRIIGGLMGGLETFSKKSTGSF
jgi:hypothetical protein